MGESERDLMSERPTLGESSGQEQGGSEQAEPRASEGQGGAGQTEAPEHPLVGTVNSIRDEIQAARGEIEALAEQLSGHRDVANLGPQIALARTIATRLGSVGSLLA